MSNTNDKQKERDSDKTSSVSVFSTKSKPFVPSFIMQNKTKKTRSPAPEYPPKEATQPKELPIPQTNKEFSTDDRDLDLQSILEISTTPDSALEIRQLIDDLHNNPPVAIVHDDDEPLFSSSQKTYKRSTTKGTSTINGGVSKDYRTVSESSFKPAPLVNLTMSPGKSNLVMASILSKNNSESKESNQRHILQPFSMSQPLPETINDSNIFDSNGNEFSFSQRLANLSVFSRKSPNKKRSGQAIKLVTKPCNRAVPIELTLSDDEADINEGTPTPLIENSDIETESGSDETFNESSTVKFQKKQSLPRVGSCFQCTRIPYLLSAAEKARTLSEYDNNRPDIVYEPSDYDKQSHDSFPFLPPVKPYFFESQESDSPGTGSDFQRVETTLKSLYGGWIAKDKLLELYYRNKYITQQTVIAALLNRQKVLFASPRDCWTPIEKNLFEAGLREIGKDWQQIQFLIKSKSLEEILVYYYYWKSTARCEEFCAKLQLVEIDNKTRERRRNNYLAKLAEIGENLIFEKFTFNFDFDWKLYGLPKDKSIEVSSEQATKAYKRKRIAESTDSPMPKRARPLGFYPDSFYFRTGNGEN